MSTKRDDNTSLQQEQPKIDTDVKRIANDFS